MGFNPSELEEQVYAKQDPLSQLYHDMYLELRSRAFLHRQRSQHPPLGLCLKPTGAFDWQPTIDPSIQIEEVEFDSDSDSDSEAE